MQRPEETERVECQKSHQNNLQCLGEGKGRHEQEKERFLSVSFSLLVNSLLPSHDAYVIKPVTLEQRRENKERVYTCSALSRSSLRVGSAFTAASRAAKLPSASANTCIHTELHTLMHGYRQAAVCVSKHLCSHRNTRTYAHTHTWVHINVGIWCVTTHDSFTVHQIICNELELC